MGSPNTSFQLIGLDFAILDVLPEEGTVLGFTELGKQVKSIVTELNSALPKGAPKITSANVNGRIRMLRDMHATVTVVVQPVSRGLGWQRTRKGKRMLAERAAKGSTTTPELEGASQ